MTFQDVRDLAVEAGRANLPLDKWDVNVVTKGNRFAVWWHIHIEEKSTPFLGLSVGKYSDSLEDVKKSLAETVSRIPERIENWISENA